MFLSRVMGKTISQPGFPSYGDRHKINHYIHGCYNNYLFGAKLLQYILTASPFTTIHCY